MNRDTHDDTHLSISGKYSIDIICCLVYFFDVYCRFGVNNKRQSAKGHMWTVIRLVCISVVFLESLLIVGNASIGVTTALVPLIYITRRESLRQMVQGIISSVKKCLEIFCVVLVFYAAIALLFLFNSISVIMLENGWYLNRLVRGLSK